MLKRYWDILSGIVMGIALAILADFKYEKVQLIYSVIILVLVSIGFFRILRQEIEKKCKRKKERKHTLIDDIVDGQRSIKAINLAQEPIYEGEKLGKTTINLIREIKTTMEKIKVFFSKFKGYMLTIALAVLTLVEMCGAPINALFGGALTVKGIEILPVITLACTAVVGIISNGFTKEQREQIKNLVTAKNGITNDLVLEEIKKTIKTQTANLGTLNKTYTKQTHDLTQLEVEVTNLNNTLVAKKQMAAMVPQLATVEDVKAASDELEAGKARVANLKAEIEKTKKDIESVTSIIKALKSQL